MPMIHSEVESKSPDSITEPVSGVGNLETHQRTPSVEQFRIQDNGANRCVLENELISDELNAILVTLNTTLRRAPVLTILICLSLFTISSAIIASLTGFTTYLIFAMPAMLLLTTYAIIQSQRVQNQLTFLEVILPKLESELANRRLTFNALLIHLHHRHDLNELKAAVHCWMQSCLETRRPH